jgi:hypothetical protein
MMRAYSMKFMIKSLLLWEAVDYIMYMTYGMEFFIPSYPCILDILGDAVFLLNPSSNPKP